MKGKPMPNFVVLPNYQIETKSTSNLYPSQNQAENAYRSLVSKNVPCEFYKEGQLQKEYKPK